MKKRFVVLLGETTNEQDKAFLEWVKAANLWWWHWLAGSWLFIDYRAVWTAAEIRDALLTAFPGVHSVVLELRGEDDSWAGFGFNAPPRDMFKWIQENWAKKQD